MTTQAQKDAENLNRTLKKTLNNYKKLSGGIPSSSSVSVKELSKQIVSAHRGGSGT